MVTHGLDVVDTVEYFQCTKCVEHHLRIVFRLNQNPTTVLIVHDGESPISNDYAVTGAEAVLDEAGIIKALLDEYDGVRAAFLCCFHQFQYIGGIIVRAILHLLTVIAQVFRGVLCFHAERRFQLKLAKAMSIRSFCGIVAALILIALAKPSGWWAV